MKIKIYNKICKRCGKPFETESKHGKICEKCKLPRGGNNQKKL